MAPNNLNSGQRETVAVGGAVFTDLANLIQLIAYSGGAGTNGTFRKAIGSGTAGYQVPVGKTFKVRAIRLTSGQGAGAVRIRLLYADNDVGMSSGTAFTNPIYMGNNISGFDYIVENSTPNFKTQEYVALFDVPAQKYLCMFGGAVDVFATVYGYEV